MVENSQFLESQCEFLVEKFNSAQCPELDKISASLPSVEEYTLKHGSDQGFVSYESDPHQFMLNLLSSELDERSALEGRILELQAKETLAKNDIGSKRKFIASIASKLFDLNKSLEGVVKLFGAPDTTEVRRLAGIESVTHPDLFVVANKIHALVDPGVGVTVRDASTVIATIRHVKALPPSASAAPIIVRFVIADGSVTAESDRGVPVLDWVAGDACRLVEFVRATQAVQLWDQFEWASLSKNPKQSLPVVSEESGDSWLTEGESAGSDHLMSLTRDPSGCIAAVVLVNGEKYNQQIFVESHRVKISKPGFVSSIDGSEDSRVVVDMGLAQVELLVRNWWTSRANALSAKPVAGQLSAVLVKTINLLSQL